MTQEIPSACECVKPYDGDIPDSFDGWVTDMDVDELIALGDRAMNRLSNELKSNR